MAAVIPAICASLLCEGERLGLARRPGPALLSATGRRPRRQHAVWRQAGPPQCDLVLPPV